MSTLPIPNALELSARKLGLHVKTTATEGGALTAVLVYRTPDEDRAMVTWERGAGLVMREGYTWKPCSLTEANTAMVDARYRYQSPEPWEDDQPEPCECDQVQALRQSLAKAHAAAAAAGAQLRKVQGERDDALSEVEQQDEYWQEFSARMMADQSALHDLLDRCLAKMPEGMEHGGCLETAVDLLCRGMLMPLGRGADSAQEYDRLAAECHGASRGSGEFSAPWVGQGKAMPVQTCSTCARWRDKQCWFVPDKPHGTYPTHSCKEWTDSPLDDPRMDGEQWLNAQDVTQAMLDAWPVWEWFRADRDLGGIELASTLSADGQDRLWQWRPLRLPGMNEKGWLTSEDMTEVHFERVRDWQIFERQRWQRFDRDLHYLQREYNRLLRPAIFAKLDQEETT